MGASISVNRQTVQNELITQAVNSCPPVAGANVVNWSGVTLRQPPGCPPDSSFDISQASVVDATCLLNSMQNVAASTIGNLDANAQAGLGLAATRNESDIRNQISNITNNTCAGVSTTNYVNWQDVDIESCRLAVTQNATQNVRCQIDATQDLINKVATTMTSQAEGGSIFGNIFGSGPGGIIVLVVIAVLIIAALIGAYFFFTKSNKSTLITATTGVPVPSSISDELSSLSSTQIGGGDSSTLWFIIVIILIVILVIFITNCCRRQNNALTEADINRLTQKMEEAQRIAGLNQSRNTVSPFNQMLSEGFSQSPVYISDDKAQIESDPFSDNAYYHANPPEYESTLDDYFQPLLY